MIDIEDRIRTVLRSEADAMRVPRAAPGDCVARRVQASTTHRRARIALVAAAAALLVAGGVVVVAQRLDEPQSAGPAPTQLPEAPTAPSTAAPTAQPAYHFETPTVVMNAERVEVITANRTWVPTADLVVDGDPGTFQESTTLELTWHDGGIEQRIYMYFRSDGVDWWAEPINTYDGRPDGDWIETGGEYFRSPLGTPFVGDLDLPNLRIHGMTLEAFRRPAVCDDPDVPVALLASYPVIDSSVGGFGASFQLFDTASCTPVPVAPYSFEYTVEDPTIVSINPRQQTRGDRLNRSRVDLELLEPGETIVRATARDATGEVVDSAEMRVTVRPPND